MGDNFFIQCQTPAKSFVGFCLCKLKRINNWKCLQMVLWFYEIVSVSCFYKFQQETEPHYEQLTGMFQSQQFNGIQPNFSDFVNCICQILKTVFDWFHVHIQVVLIQKYPTKMRRNHIVRNWQEWSNPNNCWQRHSMAFNPPHKCWQPHWISKLTKACKGLHIVWQWKYEIENMKIQIKLVCQNEKAKKNII